MLYKLGSLCSCCVLLSVFIHQIDSELFTSPGWAKYITRGAYGIDKYLERVLVSFCCLVLSCVGEGLINITLILYLLFGDRKHFLRSSTALGLLLSSLSRNLSFDWGGVFISCVIPAGYGNAIMISIKKRSVLPFLVCTVLCVISFGDTCKKRTKNLILFSDYLTLSSKGVYLCAGISTYGNYNRKVGSGFQSVFARDSPEKWQIEADSSEEPYLNNLGIIKSGALVHIKHFPSGMYLQTFDVASPLTLTNQEVSLAAERSQDTLFVVVGERGTPSLTSYLYMNTSFGIKHMKTGVFVTVLKRRGREGYEVNGEKETGKDNMRPPEGSLFFANPEKKNLHQKLLDFSEITKISVKRYKKILLTHEKFEKSFIYSGFCLSVFIVSMVLHFLAGTDKKHTFISCVLDLFFSCVLHRDIEFSICSAGLVGIETMPWSYMQHLIKTMRNAKSTKPTKSIKPTKSFREKSRKNI